MDQSNELFYYRCIDRKFLAGTPILMPKQCMVRHSVPKQCVTSSLQVWLALRDMQRKMLIFRAVCREQTDPKAKSNERLMKSKRHSSQIVDVLPKTSHA